MMGLPTRRAGTALAVLSLGVVLTCITGCAEEETREVSISETPVTVIGETVGRGRVAEEGDVVCIAYRILLPDGGTLLEHDEFYMKVGAGTTIDGIDDAVRGMRKGGRRVVKCPPHKHWGREGHGDGAVPPNTILTLHVDLKDVQ